MATKTEKDDPPKKKKKKKKSNTALWIGIAIGGGVLLLLLVVGGVLMAWRPWEGGGDPNKVAQKNPPAPAPQPQGGGQIGGQVIREPKTFLGGLRARGDRAEKDNEMRQIMLFHTQYCDLFKSANSRTMESFLDFMKRDSPKLYNDLKETKYYTLNLKARVGSDEIVVYETEQYTTGFYVFRANSQMGFISPQELKAAGLGK
jgi:hypothetical protein